MRYFLISCEGNEPTAVVFHDHKVGFVSCTTLSESFQKAFNVASTSVRGKFVKVDGKLKALNYDVSDFMWINHVLEKICSSGFWRIVKKGEIPHEDSAMENVALAFLI